MMPVLNIEDGLVVTAMVAFVWAFILAWAADAGKGPVRPHHRVAAGGAVFAGVICSIAAIAAGFLP